MLNEKGRKVKTKLIIVIGAYGSGKSEYSINLAKEFKTEGKEVILVDLDVVNPYFRSRDVREKFEQIGIEVIAPEGENKYADLPMISPKIMGAVKNYEKNVILDVGGDPAGCRTLARYIPTIQKRGYEMQLVINTKRPFTSNKKEILEMIQMLEDASKLQVTEIICNTNLMEFTTEEIVENGIQTIDETAKERNIIFEKYLVLDKYASKISENIFGKKKIVMNYFLIKPWEMPMMKGL